MMGKTIATGRKRQSDGAHTARTGPEGLAFFELRYSTLNSIPRRLFFPSTSRIPHLSLWTANVLDRTGFRESLLVACLTGEWLVALAPQ